MIELKTGLIIKHDNYYAAHGNKTTEVRNIRNLVLFKSKPQNAVFLSLEPADGMVRITSNNCESDSTYFTWHPTCV